MKVLIVEDETAAYESMVDILHEIDVNIEIIGNTESVSQTINWLRINQVPDLIFMDIHLSDGSAFLIFEYIEVAVPIIFTTAYDEYAIKAFKVNSIDYLLKPIKTDELQRALTKFYKLSQNEIVTYLSKIPGLADNKRFKDRLLIPIKDTLLPIEVKHISYFYTSERTTFICMEDGAHLPYSGTLEQIYSNLSPDNFYRANKQFIVSRPHIKNITIWFDNRLLLTLDTEVPESVYISKNKAADFKSWIVKG